MIQCWNAPVGVHEIDMSTTGTCPSVWLQMHSSKRCYTNCTIEVECNNATDSARYHCPYWWAIFFIVDVDQEFRHRFCLVDFPFQVAKNLFSIIIIEGTSDNGFFVCTYRK